MRIKKVAMINQKVQVERITAVEGQLTAYWLFSPHKEREGTCMPGVYVARLYNYNMLESGFVLTDGGHYAVPINYSEKNLEYYFGDTKEGFRDTRTGNWDYPWMYTTSFRYPLMPFQTHLIFYPKGAHDGSYAELGVWVLRTTFEEEIKYVPSLSKVTYAIMELELAGLWVYDSIEGIDGYVVKPLDESVAWGWRTFRWAVKQLLDFCKNGGALFVEELSGGNNKYHGLDALFFEESYGRFELKLLKVKTFERSSDDSGEIN